MKEPRDMMAQRPRPPAEEPRSEPEIIPPDRAGRGPAGVSSQARVFVDTHGTERIYIATPGPLGIILVALTAGILSAVLLILLLGAFLIWVPVVAFFIAGATIAGILRRKFRRTP
jgi:hypothetical protein